MSDLFEWFRLTSKLLTDEGSFCFLRCTSRISIAATSKRSIAIPASRPIRSPVV